MEPCWPIDGYVLLWRKSGVYPLVSLKKVTMKKQRGLPPLSMARKHTLIDWVTLETK